MTRVDRARCAWPRRRWRWRARHRDQRAHSTSR
jgi:hypothetical protein